MSLHVHVGIYTGQDMINDGMDWDALNTIEESLKRSWVWFAESDQLVDHETRKSQNDISLECELKLQQLNSIDIEFLSDGRHFNRILSFCGRFYYNKESCVPWASEKSCQYSKEIVNKLIQIDQSKVIETIISDVVTVLNEIKQLGLSNNVNISGYRQQTRLAINQKLLGQNYSKVLDQMDSFKLQHVTRMGLINILIENADIESNWRYILPFLLTFLDDADLGVKREACNSLNEIFKSLLSSEKIKDNIILKSQTMPLFTNAMQALLLALPSLTPEWKSRLILPLTYETTFRLYKLAIPNELERYTRLGSLLNDTLLPSLSKCKDYVELTLIILSILKDFIKECDGFAIVLCKQIIYTLITILMDPFIVHADKVVLGIIDILQDCIDEIPKERRHKYYYDIKGCMGTLERRIDIRDGYFQTLEKEKIDKLMKSVEKERT